MILNTITASVQLMDPLILCNSPFYQRFQHAQALSDQFIHACHKKIHKNGHALLLTNEFIFYPLNIFFIDP